MAVPSSMAFRKMLVDIGDRLSERDLRNMKYFCRDVIPRGPLEEVERPMELWDALEERGKISGGNIDFLRVLLSSGTEGRTDLLQILEDYQVWQRPRVGLVDGPAAIPACTYRLQQDRLQNHHFTGPTYNELKREMDFLVKTIGRDWRRLLRELGVSEADMDYLYEAHPRDLREIVRQGLLLWQRQGHGQASKESLLQALKLCSRNDLVHTLSSGNY